MLSISNRTFRAFSSQLLARLYIICCNLNHHHHYHHCQPHLLCSAALSHCCPCPQSHSCSHDTSSTQSPKVVLAIRSQSTLIVAEHNNEKLNAATLHAVTAAGQLGGEVGEVVPVQFFDCFQVNCLVAGTGCAAVAKEVAAVSGVSKVRN